MTGRIPAALALLVIAALVAAGVGTPRVGAAVPRSCSGLTSVLTLTSNRRPVDFHVRRTTIAALAQRERPRHFVRGASAYEHQSFEVVAQIVLVRRTLNNTVRVVLFDDGAYMSATLPPLACIRPGTPGGSLIKAARSSFVGGCGLPTPEWTPLGAVAYVSGVGYWGPTRGRRGAARNGAEFAPVTGLRFLAGCGAH